jgi:hypothetical protein
MNWTMTSALLATVLGLAGCGAAGNIRHAINHYDDEEYLDASEAWQELASTESTMTEKARVRYLVFRGLTHLHLGENEKAKEYLSKGHEAWTAARGRYLPSEYVFEMNDVLQQLFPGSQPPQPGPTSAPIEPQGPALASPPTPPPSPEPAPIEPQGPAAASPPTTTPTPAPGSVVP